jgi:transaldolase
MRPRSLATRIFLDGGNPEETKEIMEVLGFLDGQTTNPTLISKNPGVKEHIERGGKYSREQLNDYYRDVVRKISSMIPGGSISVEVYSDVSSRADELLVQGREMFSWIPNAHVKFPTSAQGLQAASRAIGEGMRVNMTLCFSQPQAAAVYAATKGARKGDVFVSPFIGRLDDRGENGMDLIADILCTYDKGDGHVEVLTASVRNLDHLMYAVKLGSHIITSPFNVLKEWGEKGLPMPGVDYEYDAHGLRPIPYQEIDLSRSWQDYDIRHELTDVGMEKFSRDWNSLIK